MQKFIVIPDSFKGTISSDKACEIIENKIKQHFTDSKVTSIPVADGGEGTVDCFIKALNGKKIYCDCVNPYMEKMQGYYAIVNNDTAIIEMAVCSGLPLVEDRKNPLKTTTFGVGQIVLDALSKNVKKIIVGLGGSATNDFGCGMISALGVDFFDKDNKSFIPTGGTLKNVEDFSVSKLDKRLSDVKIEVMCDVKNPIFGKTGASYVYAPQKGANEEQVAILDNGLRHITELVEKKFNIDIKNVEGLGAAGAMAGGLVSFLNAKIKMGIETVLDEVKFDDLIDKDTIIFTGEGKIDGQSLMGKVIYGIGKRAKQKGAKVIVVAGGVNDSEIKDVYNLGINSVFSINRLPQDFSVAKNYSEQNLEFTVDNILRLLK